MKENDVAKLASLLQKQPDEISTALENGGVSEFIDNFVSGNSIMPVGDFETFKANYEKQVVEKLSTSDKLPKVLYDRIKGTVLEMKEKELAQKFDISDFNGIEDLVEKVVQTKAKNPEDVTKLRAKIDELSETHRVEVDNLRRANDQRYVDFRINEVVGQVDIDAEGKMLENQRRILSTMLKNEYGFIVKDDSVVATKAGEPIVNNKLEPIPLNDVVRDFAKEIVKLKSPDGGGRGEGSSAHGATVKSVVLKDYMQKNNIRPNSSELASAIKDFRARGIEIIE